MPMSPRLLRPRASNNNVASDADARAYIEAVRLADGQYMEPAVQLAVNDFVTGCKADGIWSAIKASCLLMGARTLSGALTPLVGTAPTNVNFVSGDYNRKTGLVADASTKYLNTGRPNNTSPQDNRHAAAYVTTLPASGGMFIGAGGNGIGSTNIGRGGIAGDQAFFRSVPSASDSTQNTHFHSTTVSTGFFGQSRSSGTEFLSRQAGVTDTVTSTAGTSGTPSSDNVFIFARNTGSGTANSYGASRIAYYSLGESLTLSLLDARVTTLFNAIGAAIP
jgi:hypothetical protein